MSKYEDKIKSLSKIEEILDEIEWIKSTCCQEAVDTEKAINLYKKHLHELGWKLINATRPNDNE